MFFKKTAEPTRTSSVKATVLSLLSSVSVFLRLSYPALILTLLHGGLLFILLANLVYLWRGRRRVVPEPLPSISVLIPARNEEANLERLLPSLLAQSYPDVQIVVYDDGSDDDTWGVIRRWQARSNGRIQALQGNGPPPGWIGKVHALFQATRHASGDLYLFLDADAELQDPEALQRLVERFKALPPDAVMTGLPQLRGGGALLVSLIPNALLTGLPWPLVRRLPVPAFGALNGQCWMIPSTLYHRYEPHEHLPSEILEDVKIGRYLRRQGLVPTLMDVRREVAVYMYRDLHGAWRGLRKNAYLVLGGSPLLFVFFHLFYVFSFVFAPLFAPYLLFSLYLIKLLVDRAAGFPLWVTALAPLSFVLGAFVQLDSALAHWTGRVSWKGRHVASPDAA